MECKELTKLKKKLRMSKLEPKSATSHGKVFTVKIYMIYVQIVDFYIYINMILIIPYS